MHPLRGYSLIEVLVVMGISAVLAALLFTVVHQARAKSLQAVCIGNQRQLVAALLAYQQDHGGYPAEESVWQDIASPAKLLRCPAAPRAPIGYTYNGALAGLDGSNSDDPTAVFLTADGDSDAFIARHSGKCLVSYEDGHVALTALDDIPE